MAEEQQRMQERHQGFDKGGKKLEEDLIERQIRRGKLKYRQGQREQARRQENSMEGFGQILVILQTFVDNITIAEILED